MFTFRALVIKSTSTVQVSTPNARYPSKSSQQCSLRPLDRFWTPTPLRHGHKNSKRNLYNPSLAKGILERCHLDDSYASKYYKKVVYLKHMKRSPASVYVSPRGKECGDLNHEDG